MIDINVLPTVNASLNGFAGVLLLIGRYFIAKKNIPMHRAFMIAAFSTSAVFLASYLYYHFSSHLVTRYDGEGIARIVYFSVLISHSTLAAAVPVLAIITLFRGLKLKVVAHRAIAKWTFPIWLYVSATGVVVYVMLYHL